MKSSDVRLVYIAGPYRAPTPEDIRRNVRAAEALGQAVIETGLPLLPVVPHSIGHRFGYLRPDDEGYWLPATMALMERCHVVLMIPGWEDSEGSVEERARALALGLPVFETVDDLVKWAQPRTYRPDEVKLVWGDIEFKGFVTEGDPEKS